MELKRLADPQEHTAGCYLVHRCEQRKSVSPKKFPRLGIPADNIGYGNVEKPMFLIKTAHSRLSNWRFGVVFYASTVVSYYVAIPPEVC